VALAGVVIAASRAPNGAAMASALALKPFASRFNTSDTTIPLRSALDASDGKGM
jgi:hypothetical protein